MATPGRLQFSYDLNRRYHSELHACYFLELKMKKKNQVQLNENHELLEVPCWNKYYNQDKTEIIKQ
jgi:hypothetical protein